MTRNIQTRSDTSHTYVLRKYIIASGSLRKLSGSLIVTSISVKLILHIMELNLNYKWNVNGLVVYADKRA